jgi:hypothetical protein
MTFIGQAGLPEGNNCIELMLDRLRNKLESVPLITKIEQVEVLIVSSNPLLGLAVAARKARMGHTVGLHIIKEYRGWPYWLHENSVILSLLWKVSGVSRHTDTLARWFEWCAKTIAFQKGSYYSECFTNKYRQDCESLGELSLETLPAQFESHDSSHLEVIAKMRQYLAREGMSPISRSTRFGRQRLCRFEQAIFIQIRGAATELESKSGGRIRAYSGGSVEFGISDADDTRHERVLKSAIHELVLIIRDLDAGAHVRHI